MLRPAERRRGAAGAPPPSSSAPAATGAGSRAAPSKAEELAALRALRDSTAAVAAHLGRAAESVEAMSRGAERAGQQLARWNEAFAVAAAGK